MKSMFKSIVLACMAALFFTGCEKDENRVVFEGGKAPLLSANRAATIPIAFATKDEEAVTFSWTNPDYKFNTGVSSQDVNYILEIDTAGADFSSPNIKRVAVSKELSVSFTQGEINDFLLNQLVLQVNRTYNVEVRVISFLGNNVGKLISNRMEFSIRTYSIPPKVTPPGTAPDYLDGKLFMVGSATPGGWNNPVPVPTQEFTRVSATLYELTLQLNGGQSYLFLPINGFWGAKFGGLGGNNTNNPAGDDFKPEGGDLIAPSAPGLYKISVDFQRGKFSVTPI